MPRTGPRRNPARRRNARNTIIARKDHGLPEPSTAAMCAQEDLLELRYRRNTERPAKTADAPSCSSIRISWLYLASRSDRDSDPVLIWPQLVATARSAIVTSSVSPERCDMTAR